MILSLGLSFSLVGCATIFGSKSYLEVVEGTPPKAEIYMNGIYLGQTPLNFEIPDKAFGQDSKIEIKAKGYKPLSVTIEKKAKVKFVILDILSAATGLIVDCATGALYEPSNKIINYVLEKERKN